MPDHAACLESLMPDLERIALRLAPLSCGVLDAGDVLNIMAVSFLEHADRLSGQRPAYIRQHCAWAARLACRTARNELKRAASLELVAVADGRQDPERLATRRDEQDALSDWFEQVTAGRRLTCAQRRTVAEAQAGRRTRSRANWCQMMSAIRAKYPNPQVSL